MRDPYLYEDIPVLKNKLGIKDQDTLDGAEANYASLRLKDLAMNPLKGNYHTPHFLKMHEVVFQDLYDWAGSPRTIAIYKEEDVHGGMSIEYSDSFDILTDLSNSLSEMRNKDWVHMDRSVSACCGALVFINLLIVYHCYIFSILLISFLPYVVSSNFVLDLLSVNNLVPPIILLSIRKFTAYGK